VVAGEVRNLAQRSATAAKEIKGLIADSVDKVRNGTFQVEVAGRTMDETVGAIRRVSQLMSEISTATLQQTEGISHVNDSVTQLDQMTQQNAALVEQAASAAESMRQQAARLDQVVASFRLSMA
jgi:methyl-accepting chemotaxis protein